MTNTLAIFLVHNGIIIHEIYYKSRESQNYHISHGKKMRYTSVKLDIPIFCKIFQLLKYTGFACIDFKIIDDNIKIFEINPRLGGTLVHNKNDLRITIEKTVEYFYSVNI